MRFEIEVNTIPHGATGKVNPILHWDSGRNGPPYKKLFVCMFFAKPSSSWLVQY